MSQPARPMECLIEVDDRHHNSEFESNSRSIYGSYSVKVLCLSKG